MPRPTPKRSAEVPPKPRRQGQVDRSMRRRLPGQPPRSGERRSAGVARPRPPTQLNRPRAEPGDQHVPAVGTVPREPPHCAERRGCPVVPVALRRQRLRRPPRDGGERRGADRREEGEERTPLRPHRRAPVRRSARRRGSGRVPRQFRTAEEAREDRPREQHADGGRPHGREGAECGKQSHRARGRPPLGGAGIDACGDRASTPKRRRDALREPRRRAPGPGPTRPTAHVRGDLSPVRARVPAG